MGQIENTHQQDKKTGTIVFILGAGCSVDCGAPLMKDFVDVARRYARESECPFRDDYEAVLGFHDDCARVPYIDKWWGNIEDLFTQAHLRRLLEVEGSDKLFDGMKRVIWDIYRRSSSSKAAGYYTFVRYLFALVHSCQNSNPPGSRPVIITTNYDTHLEAWLIGAKSMFENRAIACRPEYPGIECPPGGDSGIGSGRWIEVIKFHGSINWFQANDQTIFCTLANHQSQEPLPAILTCQSEPLPDGYTPLIVPPMLGKTAIDNTSRKNWIEAVRVMNLATQIIVAGYSFPETDLFMTRLLTEGLRDNRNLERILIINPETRSEWWHRVEASFSRSWWANRVHQFATTFHDASGKIVEKAKLNTSPIDPRLIRAMPELCDMLETFRRPR